MAFTASVSGIQWKHFAFAAIFGLLLQSAVAQQRQPNTQADYVAGRLQTAEPKIDKAHPHKNQSTIYVDCSNPSAKVRTIGAGLTLLGSLRPALLLISGTCHENVVIQSLDRITLQGNPTATIDGGTDPNLGAVTISDSQSIELVNLTITGSGQGVTCNAQSLCRLTQSTVQNSLGGGVSVAVRSHLQISDTVIQNNVGGGLFVLGGSVNFFGGSISGNSADGVVVGNGSFLRLLPGDIIPGVTIQNNAGNGISANLQTTLVLNSANVTNNAGDGVSLQSGSAASIAASTVTNNLGHQLRIGDLSFVRFVGFQSNTISGANPPDIVCDPQFSATRQLVAATTGATTNCPAELAPTP